MDILRPYLSRILASLVASFVAWLAGKGIMLNPDTAAQLTDAGLAVLFAVFQIVYAVVHKSLDKKLNPADTASKQLAVEGKAKAHALKQGTIPTRRV